MIRLASIDMLCDGSGQVHWLHWVEARGRAESLLDGTLGGPRREASRAVRSPSATTPRRPLSKRGRFLGEPALLVENLGMQGRGGSAVVLTDAAALCGDLVRSGR